MSKEILIHQKMEHNLIVEFTPPTFEGEKEIISIINEGIYFMTDEQKEKVQKLITHYDHLKYFSAINSDVWADFVEPLKK